jgi:glycosyltransferase involved in cell wall biosynthesis
MPTKILSLAANRHTDHDFPANRKFDFNEIIPKKQSRNVFNGVWETIIFGIYYSSKNPRLSFGFQRGQIIMLISTKHDSWKKTAIIKKGYSNHISRINIECSEHFSNGRTTKVPKMPFNLIWLDVILVLGLAFRIGHLQLRMPTPQLKTFNVRLVVVSVLVPNYNKGPYVERALKSVLRQSLPDLEVVFSDDASNDLPFELLLPFLASDVRIRFWRNARRLGANNNRAKCVCAARGIWVLSLDSDDELMNQTAEIAIKTHQQTGADVCEFKILQCDSQGRLTLHPVSRIEYHGADNNTLTRALREGKISWLLAYRMVMCLLYQRALLLMGLELCTAFINIAEDKLHLATILRFVHKYVTIDYLGYLYCRNVKDNSRRRTPNWKPVLVTVNNLIAQILELPLPELFDDRAMNRLCLTIKK